MNTDHFFEEDSISDSEDALSLCDLSFTDNTPKDILHDNSSSPDEEDHDEDSFCFFENPSSSTRTLSPIDSFLLFGKSVPYSKPSNLQYTKEEDHEQRQERLRAALFRSDSFNRPSSSLRHDGVKTDRFMTGYYGRSSSLRLAKKSESSSAPIGNSRNNFSSSSKKHKAMALSENKRRQSRLPPAPMFPAGSNDISVSGKSLWGLLRLFKRRSTS